MTEWLIGFALLVPGIVWPFAFVRVLSVMRNLRSLAQLPVDAQRTEWPTLSVISPACNEAASIERALSSLLGQDYPSLQIISIDDRSTDGTGALIDAVAARDARVVPVHVTTLPDGWLGKLNAMNEGVKRATGAWLLFTDADVRFEPLALKRAVTFAEGNALDFVTAFPQLESAGFLADTIFAAAGTLLALTARPQRVRDVGTRDVVGIGAFMLVRRSAYERTAGFEWLKLEVADDMGLCLLIKRAGGRCDVLNGNQALKLRWYESFTEMKEKMQKNFFALTARFSVVRAVALSITIAAVALAPLLALHPQAPRWLVWLTLFSQLCFVASSVLFGAWTGVSNRVASFFPQVALLLFSFMSLRAGLIGARIGGIAWRGTRYSSSELSQSQRFRL